MHARARCTWHAFHVHDRCETRVYSRERRLCNIGWIDITGGFMWAPSSRYDRLSRSLEGVSTWHLCCSMHVLGREMGTCTLGRGVRGMHSTFMFRSEAGMACARARSGAVYVACISRSCSDVRQVWHAHVHARARCTWHAFQAHAQTSGQCGLRTGCPGHVSTGSQARVSRRRAARG